ncbi:hypothetical protein RJ641_013278 [Dillenia turbinata]|uniref:Uncharacterized protein n=1 Tax=Dillenia turbinata TaxID=194707 RepID=A0AAN8ZL98_9MAGN
MQLRLLIDKIRRQLTFMEEHGSGAVVTVTNRRISVGTLEGVQRSIFELEDFTNHYVVYVGVNNILAGLIFLEDQIRDDAGAVIKYLSMQGISTYMLSGDKKNAAEDVASVVGLKTLDYKSAHVLSGVKPDEKKFISKLQKDENIVVMVGDGINAAAALASSNVEVAIGGGVRATSEVSSIVLMGSKLSLLWKEGKKNVILETIVKKKKIAKNLTCWLCLRNWHLSIWQQNAEHLYAIQLMESFVHEKFANLRIHSYNLGSTKYNKVLDSSDSNTAVPLPHQLRIVMGKGGIRSPPPPVLEEKKRPLDVCYNCPKTPILEHKEFCELNLTITWLEGFPSFMWLICKSLIEMTTQIINYHTRLAHHTRQSN